MECCGGMGCEVSEVQSVGSVECEVWGEECEVCGMWGVGCGMRDMEVCECSRMKSVRCGGCQVGGV